MVRAECEGVLRVVTTAFPSHPPRAMGYSRLRHGGCVDAPGLPALWPCEARRRGDGTRPDAVVAGGSTAGPGWLGVAEG